MFWIEVSDSETSPGIPAVGSSNFTIAIMSITTTLLPSGFGDVPYSGGTVTVAGGSTPYSWTASNLPPGLSLSPACTGTKLQTCAITGTPTQTGNYSPTFQVTDGEKQNPAVATAQLSISIVPAVTNANLNGNYVFSFSGYNNGTPAFMAGAFVADGKGTLSSGELDYNNGSGEGVPPVQQTFVTGSVYNIGGNGLGTMTIVTNVTTYQFAIAVTSDGSGSLIQSDSSNKEAYGSGAIKVQTVNTLCPTFQGVNVAVGLFGIDSSLKRYAGAGQFNFNNNTCADIAGIMDFDDNGSLTCGGSPCTFSGAFNGGDSLRPELPANPELEAH